MEIPDYVQLVPWAGVVISIGTAILTVQKVYRNVAKERKEHAAEILQTAKEDDALMKALLEARIEALESNLENLKENVNKDISHVKETYKGEIRNLAEKIDNLRSDLSAQHGSLVQLLSRLVDREK